MPPGQNFEKRDHAEFRVPAVPFIPRCQNPGNIARGTLAVNLLENDGSHSHDGMMAQPDRHLEAVTSRPRLLQAVGRLVTTGRRKIIRLTPFSGNNKNSLASRSVAELLFLGSTIQNHTQPMGSRPNLVDGPNQIG